MIKEGARMDEIDKEIIRLKSLHKHISDTNPLEPRLHNITQKIEKLQKEKKNWEMLWSAVDEGIDVPPAHHQHVSSISPDFIKYIKTAEIGSSGPLQPKHLKVYDVVGVPHIGYGHRVKSSETNLFKNGITQKQADDLLLRDLEIAKKNMYSEIKSIFHVSIPLDRKQEEMLTDFEFNLGTIRSFPKFAKAVLNKDWKTASQEYKRSYTDAKGIKKELGRNQLFYNRYFGNPELIKEVSDYIGNVDSYGNINGVKSYDSRNQIHHLGFIGTGDRWRYLSHINCVIFTTEPSYETIKIVENWLNKMKIFPRKIVTPNHPTGISSYDPYKNVAETIKNLITEGIREKAMEDFLAKIIKGTEWEGKVFIAGGYVRDEYMGKDPKDLDLLVNAPNGGFKFAKWITQKLKIYKGPEVDPPIPPEPDINWTEDGKPATPQEQQIFDEWLSKLAAIQKLYTNPVIFPRFGTVKFNLRRITHNGVDLSDMDIECVMPRKEEYRKGSRKPKVIGGELKDDVERRDFTVNSLLKDLSTGEILDLTGMGKDDIKSGVIKTALDPDKIFKDDPLRMLRAIRFAVKYNWKLPMFMLRGLKKNASQLQHISQERISGELDKMIVTDYPKKAIELMRITGLLRYVIPELIPLIKLQQNRYHKHDAFDHTLEVLSKTQPVLIQRLMALFHDIGKFATKTVTDTGIHFYGHEKEGEKIVHQVMSRLKYPNELISAVAKGVRNHMKLKHGGPEGTGVSDKTLRQFTIEMGNQLENILNLVHADNISHSDGSSMPNQINKIRERLKTLNIKFVKPELPINGNDLKQYGIKPGPIYKKLLDLITDKWYENPNITKEEAMKIIYDYLQNDK